MTGRANRDRGARAERAVVNYLRANGFPGARRYLAGDGRQPGDIDFHPHVCLDVKDRKRSAWPTWRAQALAEARPGQLIIVVRRVRGVTDVGRWEAQLPFSHSITLNPRLGAAVWCPRTERWWCSALFAAVVDRLDPPTFRQGIA